MGSPTETAELGLLDLGGASAGVLGLQLAEGQIRFEPSDPPATMRSVSATAQLALEGLNGSNEAIVSKRSGALYGVHAYHTKVPPAALAGLIEAHTEAGEFVLDPFSGSGMTGVAAALSGRRAFLNDLSPAAVHIASNYTTACDPACFAAGVQRVLERVGPEVASFYETTAHGGSATVEYLVWSDRRRCPKCDVEFLLWDKRDLSLRALRCSSCGFGGSKSAFPLVGEEAVEANLSTAAVARRVVRPPTERDLGLDALPERLPWTPTAAFGSERPMWRRGHDDLAIASVGDFYSRRNLAAMALLWNAAAEEPDERVRSALRFSLTAIANRASRRYQWNAKRPTNVLGGTLYVSSLRYEWNVLSLWRRKTAAVLKLFRDSPMPNGAVQVHRGSATALPLNDRSVDYIATDPPFGAHIVYSDASLLWEGWLDDFTDRAEEAIVVPGGDRPKTVSDYEGVLRDSFTEMHRVLKPGRAATVVFQATDPAVWAAIQRAASDAGFDLRDATTLDKGQPSFKQIKGHNGERVATTDVVLTFARRSEARPALRRLLTPVEATKETLRHARTVGRVSAMPMGKLYASVNARLLATGAERVIGYDELLAVLREHFLETDEGWSLT